MKTLLRVPRYSASAACEDDRRVSVDGLACVGEDSSAVAAPAGAASQLDVAGDREGLIAAETGVDEGAVARAAGAALEYHAACIDRLGRVDGLRRGRTVVDPHGAARSSGHIDFTRGGDKLAAAESGIDESPITRAARPALEYDARGRNALLSRIVLEYARGPGWAARDPERTARSHYLWIGDPDAYVGDVGRAAGAASSRNSDRPRLASAGQPLWSD